MARLRLELLGGFSARLEGGQPCTLPTRKARALLAYLALPAGRFHSRDKLTALLWGDTPEAQARQSFRQALTSLRRVLGDGDAPGLLTHGDTIALDPGAVTVDVQDLERALADGGTEGLERAALLYRGDLLDGFGLDEPPFEEWRVVERERLHEQALEGLARLLSAQLRADGPDAAIQTALRILALDPLQEAVHRVVMRLMLRQGRRAAALEQYQVCVGWLERELGAEPEEETRQLYRQVLRAAGSTAERGAAGADARSVPGSAEALARAAPPLIGRQAERERLRAALGQMLDDGGHVVLVTGEAGIGKSRLIQEFAGDAAARGVRTVLGRCHETEQALPLHPWIDALRGERPALDVSIRERLGAAASVQLGRVFPELLDSGDDPATVGAQPALLFDALAELIGKLIAPEPLVLVVEDLHWADAMSARFLAFLGRRVHGLPVLIVGSMRPEELGDIPGLARALGELRAAGRLTEIPLSSLSEEESRALVRVLHPSARSGQDWDRLTGEICAMSEGNPFVIVESVRGVLAESPEGWRRASRLARGVRDFVAARLDRLEDLPRRLVAFAAVIGRDFPFALLPKATGVGEREAAMAAEELVRRRILDAVGDHLAICHDWIRQVAYERLLPATRTVLHAAIGDALEALHRGRLDGVADQLGHHYSRAGDAGKAIPHLVRFAELAGQRYALSEALAALQQAMSLVDRLPLPERDRRRLELALHEAFALTLLGRQSDIFVLLRRHAGDVSRVGDPALASEYYFRLAMTHLYCGEDAPGQRAAEQALQEGERAGDPERIGKALHVLAVGAFWLGHPLDGIAHATRALPLLDRPRTQHYFGLAYNDLALNHLAAGTLGSALEAADRVEAVGRATQDARLEALGSYIGAWAHALRGDLDLALARARRGVEISPERLAAGLNTGALGHAHLEGGDAAAVPLLEQAVEALGRIPIRFSEHRCLALLGEAYLSSGDVARARETASRALALSQHDGTPFNVGLAQRALGRIGRARGDLHEAEQLLSQALDSFVGCSAEFEAARTRLDLAEVRARRGDEDAARRLLRAAVAAFDAARAPKRVAEARELAKALGLERFDEPGGAPVAGRLGAHDAHAPGPVFGPGDSAPSRRR
jgi:DNA-binding SARP family transcriptional activator